MLIDVGSVGATKATAPQPTPVRNSTPAPTVINASTTVPASTTVNAQTAAPVQANVPNPSAVTNPTTVPAPNTVSGQRPKSSSTVDSNESQLRMLVGGLQQPSTAHKPQEISAPPVTKPALASSNASELAALIDVGSVESKKVKNAKENVTKPIDSRTGGTASSNANTIQRQRYQQHSAQTRSVGHSLPYSSLQFVLKTSLMTVNRLLI